MAAKVSSREAEISWSVPYSGNSIILSYHAQLSSGTDWLSALQYTIPGNTNVYSLRNLEPVTTYRLRLKCTNALGSSQYSDTIQFTTDEEGKSLSLDLYHAQC